MKERHIPSRFIDWAIDDCYGGHHRLSVGAFKNNRREGDVEVNSRSLGSINQLSYGHNPSDQKSFFHHSWPVQLDLSTIARRRFIDFEPLEIFKQNNRSIVVLIYPSNNKLVRRKPGKSVCCPNLDTAALQVERHSQPTEVIFRDRTQAVF